MGEVQEQSTNIIDQDTEESTLPATDEVKLCSSKLVQYKLWMQIVVFTIFVLSGQSVATLLGRLYFDKGGKSKWMATLIQTGGFPILLPLIFFPTTKNHRKKQHKNFDNNNIIITTKPRCVTLVSVYLVLGIFLAIDCMLYTIGLNFLPVSTYSLICASQLAFNAFFSYFLNAQKLTPFIINSLVLLTISSTLLVFQSETEKTTKISKSKYMIGFICTVVASAGYGLMVSVTQLIFQKILKRETFKVVYDMIIYQNMVATLVILVGLFASGEWKGEMESYELGKVSYVMNLVWTGVSWQVFSIGAVGLIFKVSALFSNVISTLGLPVVPIFAVVFYHDKVNGVKVISLLLAMWGFCSYIYQHYLDYLKEKTEIKTVNDQLLLSERGISR